MALPVSVAAQGDGRNQRAAETRPPDQRQSPANPSRPSWEQKQTPWWEHQAPPPWEQKAPPANAIPPFWETDVQKAQRAEWERQKQAERHNNSQPPIVYVVPQYRYFPGTVTVGNPFYVTPSAVPAPASTPPTSSVVPVGALRFDVEPRDLQVFVDGAFVGTPADLNDQIDLTPGTRRIELRARGYKAITFNVEIVRDRTITYRGSLERDVIPEPKAPTVPRAPESPKAPAVPTTIYLIPGCYLGNVAPRAAELRAGCDMSKLTKTSP